MGHRWQAWLRPRRNCLWRGSLIFLPLLTNSSTSKRSRFHLHPFPTLTISITRPLIPQVLFRVRLAGRPSQSRRLPAGRRQQHGNAGRHDYSPIAVRWVYDPFFIFFTPNSTNNDGDSRIQLRS
ncbi:hypothetical protein B9Z19DRAFT_334514 [Tuber borchii]|uniref:Uncharacterized protein n=1 Tax=Tuber borchii TaxID=42251 RepID=A0A2T6ZJC7_TUBBO|nr:hypothetical protein B9Z19DRAFT_334514 [Tuber borchii]